MKRQNKLLAACFILLLTKAVWAENRIPAGSVQIPRPHYPAVSFERGEQGKVVLLVTVSPRGVLNSVKIAESSGYPSLDEAALQAVKHGIYAKNGRWTEFYLPFQFFLPDKTPPLSEEEIRKIIESSRVPPKP